MPGGRSGDRCDVAGSNEDQVDEWLGRMISLLLKAGEGGRTPSGAAEQHLRSIGAGPLPIGFFGLEIQPG